MVVNEGLGQIGQHGGRKDGAGAMPVWLRMTIGFVVGLLVGLLVALPMGWGIFPAVSGAVAAALVPLLVGRPRAKPERGSWR